MRRWAWIGMAALLGASVAISAQTTIPSTGTVTVGSGANATTKGGEDATESELATIMRDLSNGDFTVREAAQKRVSAIGPERRDTLKALADSSNDEEVKSRVMARVDLLDEQLAENPPPISIDVKDATLEEVAAALTVATGVPAETPLMGVGRPGPAPNNSPRYTLKVDKQPFWEVIRQLNQQHPLALNSLLTGRGRRGGAITLRASPLGANLMEVQGPFMISVGGVTRTPSTAPQAEPGNPPEPAELTLVYSIAADPRLKVTQVAILPFQSLVDEKGISLLPKRLAEPTIFFSARSLQWTLSYPFSAIEGMGKKIASAKAALKLTIVVKSGTAVIQDLEKRTADVIMVGGSKVIIARFEKVADRFQLDLQRPNDGDVLRPPGATGPLPLQITLEDSTGKAINTGTMSNAGMTLSMSAGATLTGPFTLRLSIPEKTKDIVVPFELKDIPLP